MMFKKSVIAAILLLSSVSYAGDEYPVQQEIFLIDSKEERLLGDQCFKEFRSLDDVIYDTARTSGVPIRNHIHNGTVPGLISRATENGEIISVGIFISENDLRQKVTHATPMPIWCFVENNKIVEVFQHWNDDWLKNFKSQL